MKIIRALTIASLSFFALNCALIWNFSDYKDQPKDAGIDSENDSLEDVIQRDVQEDISVDQYICTPTITCQTLKQMTFRYCGNFKDDCGNMNACDCDPVQYETACGGYGWYPDGGSYSAIDPNRCGGGCGYEMNPVIGLCKAPYPIQWWCAQIELATPPIDANCIMGKQGLSEVWCCDK